jgi:SP family galactose:H+ symporter-like MFS transporter
MTVRPTRFVYLAVTTAALGGLLFGYDTGVVSGALLFLTARFALSPRLQEVVVSCVLVGAAGGSLAGGMLADRAGRRTCIIGAGALYAAAAVATALAPNLPWLIGCRVIAGAAVGVASLVAPMYISEIAPPAIRGSLIGINQIALTTGILVAYLAGYALAPARAWPWMFALAAVPGLILAAGMLALPESPRWLVARGRDAAARAVLRRVRSNGDAAGEAEAIRRSLAAQRGGFTELAAAGIRPALVVGVGLAIFQQVTGINTVIYYAPVIFRSAGFASAAASILATIGVGAVNVLTTGLAAILLDRVGRRPLLLTGLAGMVAGLGMLGLAFALPTPSAVLGRAALVSVAVYVAAFAIGLGPVFWLLISEIYPLSARGAAMSLATMANWGANFVVAVTFLSLVNAIGRPATFWLYGAVGAAAWIFAYALVPETKGRTLEEIEAHWRAGRHPRALGG